MWRFLTSILVLLSKQTTQKGLHFSSSAACAWASSSPSSPWWSTSPAAPTASPASSFPPRNKRAPPTRPPTPATRTRTGTPTRTCRRGGTDASSARWTWTCSRRPRSWRGRSGWRRGSASYGRSGWTGSRTSRGRGASIAITDDCSADLTWTNSWNGGGGKQTWSFWTKRCKSNRGRLCRLHLPPTTKSCTPLQSNNKLPLCTASWLSPPEARGERLRWLAVDLSRPFWSGDLWAGCFRHTEACRDYKPAGRRRMQGSWKKLPHLELCAQSSSIFSVFFNRWAFWLKRAWQWDNVGQSFNSGWPCCLLSFIKPLFFFLQCTYVCVSVCASRGFISTLMKYIL